eukprot:TRINITY_DN3887_c0_g1_i2.p1 TRINITY_DN3887_c0_g1~~TRINITY_DN3887_c0_g1_i2.p1  ORF type:complete len:313 (+),score=63.04 TRINITY_DN3887_c0_g1_i2:134-940(+)
MRERARPARNRGQPRAPEHHQRTTCGGGETGARRPHDPVGGQADRCAALRLLGHARGPALGRFDRLVQDEVWLRLAVLRRGAAVEHVAAMLAPCIGSETADAFAPEYVRRLRGTSARADGDVGRSFADADLERSFAALLQSKQPPQRPQPLPAAARLQAAETARRQTLQTFLLQCHDRACRSASALQPDPAAALQPGPAAALQPDPAAALQLGPAADGAPAAKRRRVSCSALAALCRQEEGARAALQEGIQAAFRQAFRKLHRRAAAA